MLKPTQWTWCDSCLITDCPSRAAITCRWLSSGQHSYPWAPLAHRCPAWPSTLSFTSRQPCPAQCQLKCTKHGWLAPRGQQRQARPPDCLQWYHSRNMTSGTRIEIPGPFRQSADMIPFVYSLFCPGSWSDYTQCHFQGPSLMSRKHGSLSIST